VIDVGDTDNWLVSSSWPLQPYLDDIIALARAQLSGLLVVLEKAKHRSAGEAEERLVDLGVAFVRRSDVRL